MRILQFVVSPSGSWQPLRDDQPENICLVIAFGHPDRIRDAGLYAQIRARFPGATVLMSSCESGLADTGSSTPTVQLTAIEFEKTKIKSALTDVKALAGSFEAGYYLSRALDPEGLKSILVIADARYTNGWELAESLTAHLPRGVLVTGGLAGTGLSGGEAAIGLNGVPQEGVIAVIGFYGTGLKVEAGTSTGWECFGPERLITRARGNILYELDDRPALDYYRMYLGQEMHNMPGAGLLFPMSVRMPDAEDGVLRTITGIDETDNSLSFAGTMPVGAYGRFMKTTTDHMIRAASDAARHTVRNIINKPELALLISGIGRKLVLNDRTNEEIGTIQSIYGSGTALAGFYGCGEISPLPGFAHCRFHNQTVTLTTFSEK